MTAPLEICIGVLALQGSFQEHVARFKRLPGVSAVEVRTKKQLEDVDGLVIPGGLLSSYERLQHSVARSFGSVLRGSDLGPGWIRDPCSRSGLLLCTELTGAASC